MTTITKTITLDLPDGQTIEVPISFDVEFQDGTPRTFGDPSGWEVLNVRLEEEE